MIRTDNDGRSWVLVDANGKEVHIGDILGTIGEHAIVTGGHPPPHGASSGRVEVLPEKWKGSNHPVSRFPHVYGLRWEPVRLETVK